MELEQPVLPLQHHRAQAPMVAAERPRPTFQGTDVVEHAASLLDGSGFDLLASYGPVAAFSNRRFGH